MPSNVISPTPPLPTPTPRNTDVLGKKNVLCLWEVRSKKCAFSGRPRHQQRSTGTSQKCKDTCPMFWGYNTCLFGLFGSWSSTLLGHHSPPCFLTIHGHILGVKYPCSEALGTPLQASVAESTRAFSSAALLESRRRSML